MRRLVVLCSAFASACLRRASRSAPETRRRPAATAEAAREECKRRSASRARKAAPRTTRRIATDPAARGRHGTGRDAAPSRDGEEGARAAQPAGAAPPDRRDGAHGAGDARRTSRRAGRSRHPDAAIAGCTQIIEDQKQKPKGRAAAYLQSRQRARRQGRPRGGDRRLRRGDQARSEERAAPTTIAATRAATRARATARSRTSTRRSRRMRATPRPISTAPMPMRRKGDARALKDYDAALKFNRRNVNAYIARGALLLAGGATAKARADMRQARGARPQERLRGAVARHRGAARQAEGRAWRRQGPADIEMKGWPAPVLLMFVGELKADARARGGRRSRCDGEGGAHLRGEFLQRRVRADRRQSRRGGEAVPHGREGLPARLPRGHRGGGRAEGAGREGRAN